jgi:hypothetical protein
MSSLQSAGARTVNLNPYKLVGSEYRVDANANKYETYSPEAKTEMEKKPKANLSTLMFKTTSSDLGTCQQTKHLVGGIRRTVPQEFSSSFPTEYRPNNFPLVYMYEKSMIETTMSHGSRVKTRSVIYTFCLFVPFLFHFSICHFHHQNGQSRYGGMGTVIPACVV